MSEDEHISIITNDSMNSESDDKQRRVKRYKHYLDVDFAGHEVSMQTRRKLFRKRSSSIISSSSETIDQSKFIYAYI